MASLTSRKREMRDRVVLAVTARAYRRSPSEVSALCVNLARMVANRMTLPDLEEWYARLTGKEDASTSV